MDNLHPLLHDQIKEFLGDTKSLPPKWKDFIEAVNGSYKSLEVDKEGKQTKLVKELESVNNELKDFAYVVSHDLKAPLRAIGSLSEWIYTDYKDVLDDDGREQLELLMSRVRRMHELIEGVLQYSRIGRIREEMTEIDLNELLTKIIDSLGPPGHISIIAEDNLPTVRFESTRLNQVFQNLIGNAIKYMDKQEGLIKVNCIDNDEFWQCSVSDNGPGIDEKNFEQIFQIFQTLRPRDEVESTGIGLTIVKKVIELYGGKIWVESAIGEGSTFLFTIRK